jgi:hypothetical protein
MILGEIKEYYVRVPWWDMAMHGLSAMMLAILAFMIVYFLYSSEKIKVNLSPGFVALFSFCFALAIGVLWEIFEFFMDSTFGSNMLKSGIVDTMWDLIMDAGGALIIAFIGFFYHKGGDSLIIERLVKRFVKLNKRIAKRH